MAKNSSNTLGLILAGGLGNRMGGVNKGLQLFQGRPLFAHVLERLQSQLEHICISANADLEAYRSSALPVWPDADPWRGMGPLAGIMSALQRMEQMHLVVVPTDVPYLPRDIVSRLEAASATSGASYVQDQPLFCYLPQMAQKQLQEYLNQGKRQVFEFLKNLNANAIPIHPMDNFKNCNYPKDLLA